jgi:hypothetical protein
MSSKFYYKGIDVSLMIDNAGSGTSNISSFQGFPSFTTTNNNYDKIDVGFATAFKDNLGNISTRNIRASSTTISAAGTSQISIPTWCNAIKVVVNSAKSSKGQPGTAGTSHGASQGGSKGQPGVAGQPGNENGYKRTPGSGGAAGDGG